VPWENPDQVAGCRQRSRPPHQPICHVLLGNAVDLHRQPQPEQQPPHRMRGPAAGQHRPDGGRAHRRHHIGSGTVLGPGQLGPAARRSR
jgi:hypothetical protein